MRGSCTSVSGQKKGLSYYRSTAQRKFKINLRDNFTSPNQNRWFRQKNLLNKFYAVLCDRNGDWWQWSSHWTPQDILGSKYTFSLYSARSSASVRSWRFPILNDLCHYYRFSLLTGWIYYGGKLEEAPKENLFAIS